MATAEELKPGCGAGVLQAGAAGVSLAVGWESNRLGVAEQSTARGH